MSRVMHKAPQKVIDVLNTQDASQLSQYTFDAQTHKDVNIPDNNAREGNKSFGEQFCLDIFRGNFVAGGKSSKDCVKGLSDEAINTMPANEKLEISKQWMLDANIPENIITAIQKYHSQTTMSVAGMFVFPLFLKRFTEFLSKDNRRFTIKNKTITIYKQNERFYYRVTGQTIFKTPEETVINLGESESIFEITDTGFKLTDIEYENPQLCDLLNANNPDTEYAKQYRFLKSAIKIYKNNTEDSKKLRAYEKAEPGVSDEELLENRKKNLKVMRALLTEFKNQPYIIEFQNQELNTISQEEFYTKFIKNLKAITNTFFADDTVNNFLINDKYSPEFFQILLKEIKKEPPHPEINNAFCCTFYPLLQEQFIKLPPAGTKLLELSFDQLEKLIESYGKQKFNLDKIILTDPVVIKDRRDGSAGNSKSISVDALYKKFIEKYYERVPKFIIPFFSSSKKTFISNLTKQKTINKKMIYILAEAINNKDVKNALNDAIKDFRADRTASNTRNQP